QASVLRGIESPGSGGGPWDRPAGRRPPLGPRPRLALPAPLRGLGAAFFLKPACNWALVLALRVSELLRGDIAMPGWDPEANDLCLRAREIPAPEDRQRFLDEACAGKPELWARVEGLLRAGAEAGSFLERPAEELGATGALAPGPQDEHTSVYR